MTAIITIMGNLGKDPSVRTTNAGQQVLTCSVGVRTSNKQQDGSYKSEWFSVSVFGNQIQFLQQNLKKGSKVLVNGDFTIDVWKDQNGVDVTTMKIKSNTFQLLDSINSNQQTNQYQNQNQNQYQQPAQQYRQTPQNQQTHQSLYGNQPQQQQQNYNQPSHQQTPQRNNGGW